MIAFLYLGDADRNLESIDSAAYRVFRVHYNYDTKSRVGNSSANWEPSSRTPKAKKSHKRLDKQAMPIDVVTELPIPEFFLKRINVIKTNFIVDLLFWLPLIVRTCVYNND